MKKNYLIGLIIIILAGGGYAGHEILSDNGNSGNGAKPYGHVMYGSDYYKSMILNKKLAKLYT